MAITAKKLGVMGEDIAAQYLLEKGYEVVVFGGDRVDKTAKVTSTLPRIHLGWVGSSRLNIGQLSKRYDNKWIEGNLPKWADISDTSVSILTNKCRKESNCFMRNQGKEDAPCYENSNPFIKENILKKYPKGRPSYVLNGKELRVSAIHAVGECSGRFNTLIGLDYQGELIPNGTFIKDNAIISNYIQQVWYHYSRRNHDKNLGGISIEAFNLFPKSHPGRYDFLAKKMDGSSDIYAVEVKVNNSKMSYWQRLRFQMLNDRGHNTMLIQLKGKAEDIELAREHGVLDGVTLTEIINPEVDALPLEGYEFDSIMPDCEYDTHHF